MTGGKLRAAVEELVEELEEPVFRIALYEGERKEGQHEGEDSERLRIAARLRALLERAP